MTLLPYYAAMRTSAKQYLLLAVCGAVCAWVTGLSSPASANEWLRLGKEGWIPSVSVFGGATVQDQEASATSHCEKGGSGFQPRANEGKSSFAPCLFLVPEPGDPEVDFVESRGALLGLVEGNNWAVTPILGFDLQLLTPTLHAIPGGPRLFVRGEIQLNFGPSRSIANEGEPSGVNIGVDTDTPKERPTSSLEGVGSRVSAETQTLGFGAVAGIAFPFEFLGRRLWLKPGVAWTHYRVDIEGVVAAGVKNDPNNVEPTQPVWGNHLRPISLSGGKSPSYNGIGPSLELEMDVGQFGPLGVSLFVGGSVYKVLGDRSVSFSATSGEIPLHEQIIIPPGPDQATHPDFDPAGRDLPADSYSAKWKYRVDPWLVRGAVGFRLHWYGF